MSEILPQDVDRFRKAIALRMGIWLDDHRLEHLAGVLDHRLRVGAESSTSYLAKLETLNGAQEEVREIAQEITVGETYFFRHTDQFRAFAEVALPARLEAQAVSRRIRLLSAGCSSGEEAYTLSILARERAPSSSWDVGISGVDVNPRAVARAREARYSAWALRETPSHVKTEYFELIGRDYVLSKAIRDSVHFEEGNLVADDTWAPHSYDVIFCRNVLMYFTPEKAQRVVQRFTRALAPGGYLFLGHAENLRGLTLDFDLRHTHSTFYYQRRDDLATRAPELRAQDAPRIVVRSALAPDWTSTWLETVQRSSDRIRALTEKHPTEVPPEPPSSACRPLARLDLSVALELLAHERFAEALEVVTKMPPGAVYDIDAVLLRAALLTHCGRLDAAELACAELLQLDGLNAGAHYLRSLCRERQADTRAAIEHGQIACYLDPTFAMPHLHLGLMARRSGDRDTAHRELTQASLLLEREGAPRLLLFGGGFSREGLAALCRSELSRLGGTQ